MDKLILCLFKVYCSFILLKEATSLLLFINNKHLIDKDFRLVSRFSIFSGI